MGPISNLRIFMPTVRDPTPPRAPRRANTTLTNRLSRRSRSSELDHLAVVHVEPEIIGRQWFDIPAQFEIVEESVKLAGYQMYAVERWITERTRAVTALTVFTGEVDDQIVVTILAPALSVANPQEEFDLACRQLNGDGTRPHTVTDAGGSEIGTIFITSLAQFHDTIVRIPSGSFLSVKSELYANIALQRTNLAGRGVVGLGLPDPAVKDRFRSTYLIPLPTIAPTHKPRQASKSLTQPLSMELSTQLSDEGDGGLFAETVLALVRLVQAALIITGDLPYQSNPPIMDGLLCDITVTGLQRASASDDMKDENILHPSLVASLLSRVIVARNHLASLPIHGSSKVTRDPFMHPKAFRRALAVYLQHSSSNTPSSTGTPTFPSPIPSFSPNGATLPTQTASAISTSLTPAISNNLSLAADSKRVGVHRVLLNKTDDGSMEITLDISIFVRLLMTADKRDYVKVAESARTLWGGKTKNTKEIERLKDLDRDIPVFIEAVDEERENRTDGKTTDDELENSAAVMAAWSGRMQRKLGAWTSRARPTQARTRSVQRIFGSLSDHNIQQRDHEDEDVLSSGQQSPILEPNPMNMLSAIDLLSDPGEAEPPANVHASPQAYEDRLRAFESIRPKLSRMDSGLSSKAPQRVASWSGQIPPDHVTERQKKSSRQSTYGEGTVTQEKKKMKMKSLRRRHSFHDEAAFDHVRVLRLDRMRIDVETCGQLLIMHRRAEHLSNVIAYVHKLAIQMAGLSDTLKKDHLNHSDAIAMLTNRASVLTQVEDLRARVDETTLERRALQYASNQLRADNLARQAVPPRQQVLMLRSRVFGAGEHGRKLPSGVRGAYGRYNRIQWKLDGTKILVDAHGRTESEVEEELAIDEAGIFAELEEDEEKEPVRNARIKPMWLLRFFTSWGARWSAAPTAISDEDAADFHRAETPSQTQRRYPDHLNAKLEDDSADEANVVAPSSAKGY